MEMDVKELQPNIFIMAYKLIPSFYVNLQVNSGMNFVFFYHLVNHFGLLLSFSGSLFNCSFLIFNGHFNWSTTLLWVLSSVYMLISNHSIF